MLGIVLYLDLCTPALGQSYHKKHNTDTYLHADVRFMHLFVSFFNLKLYLLATNHELVRNYFVFLPKNVSRLNF